MESALVLDGNLKSALATVRSLGKRGIVISVGAVRGTGMALHSCYATTRFTYPSPYTYEKDFIESIKVEAQRLGGRPVVFAFSDATWLSLYAYREVLAPHLTLIFPSETSVDIAFNKAATYSFARVSGIPTIPTHIPERFEELATCMESLTYPIVVKTRRSMTRCHGVGVFGTATFIHDANALTRTFTEWKELYGETPLIQSLIYGEEYGVEMLAHQGKVFATVTHHRLRSLSPTGGASVLKETVDEGDLRSTLEGYAQKLVAGLAWSGPIMVEFKVDSDTRIPYLMEINGRFWGSLPLSITAGVDMPYLYYQYTNGEEVPNTVLTNHQYVVTRHFLGDLHHVCLVLFARDKLRSRLYPGRMHALRNFLFLPQGTQNDVWLWKDPLPAIMEVLDMCVKVCKSFHIQRTRRV